jgi:hypothetical protein
MMGDDRSLITTGPFRPEPTEPFRESHLSLADNVQELSFDLR